MKIKKKVLVPFLFIVLISSFLILLEKSPKGEVKVYDISVIVRGKSSEVWRIVRNGMEQVASEMNVNISFITLLEENSVEEQKALIEREVLNGTDGILISPADYTELSETIKSNIKKVPIVLFESNIKTDDDLTYIATDNYEIGRSLAEEVIRGGNIGKKITILGSNLNCSSIKEKYDGFINELSLSKNTYEFIDVPKDETEIYNKILGEYKTEDTSIVIAFEPSILEIAGKAKKDYINQLGKNKKEVELYGTGSTSLIISLIEEKIINAIVMQNEFNLGYLGLKAMVSEIENKEVDNSIITSTVINIYNMYSKENQRMLFPIVR